MMFANALVPMTMTVQSDRRARRVSPRTCRVTTGALFMKGNNNPSGNPDTKKKGDDLYAWAREDQRKSLTRQRSTKFDDGIIIHAHAKSKYGPRGSASMDGWVKDDQRLSLRNEAIRENLTYAVEDCGVSWLDDDDLGVGTGACVDSINSALTLLKHADAEETASVVRTLMQSEGSHASSAIHAWCELNPNFMPHAGVVRRTIAEYDEEKEKERAQRAQRTADDMNDDKSSVGPGMIPEMDDFPLGVPLSTYFPVDLGGSRP